MKHQQLYAVATALLASVLVLTLATAPPVVLADDCASRCSDKRDECEDDAYNAYRRCQRYGEESQCYGVYQRQLDVCESEYYSCLLGC